MEDDLGLLIAVILYLGILVLAVGWFLLPRWLYGSKAMMIEKARLDHETLRNRSETPTQRQRLPPNWKQARVFPDSDSR